MMAAELTYPQELVLALVRDQHPDLADLELRAVPGGWDNQVWRLGDSLAVRMPRTERAAALLLTEQTWLPMLSERLPLAIPTPVRVGSPSQLFNRTWTIVRWVEGEPADRAPITRLEAADTLAEFLRALHHRAPAGAPRNPERGVAPADLPSVDKWFDVLTDDALADAARGMWREALAARSARVHPSGCTPICTRPMWWYGTGCWRA